MAIVKIKTAKRNIKGIIDYVTNPEKTNELLISGKDCTPETASIEMQVVKEQYNKTDGNTYFHVIQSFSPNDNITPEKAHEVGVNFADYILSSCSYPRIRYALHHPCSFLIILKITKS